MRVAVHLVLMAAVAAGMVFAAIGGSSPQAHLDLDSGLLVSTREDFQVCAEVAGPLQRDQAALVGRLETALRTVREHRDWTAAGLGARPASVTLGCPSGSIPVALDSLEAPVDEHGERVEPVDDPSPYRVWVYVLDDVTADRLLGRSVNTALAPAERVATGKHGVAEVSTAVYVRASHLDDPGFARTTLTAAAGLATDAPEPAVPAGK